MHQIIQSSREIHVQLKNLQHAEGSAQWNASPNLTRIYYLSSSQYNELKDTIVLY